MKQFATREKLDIDLLLQRNKQDMFVKNGHYCLLIHFPKS